MPIASSQVFKTAWFAKAASKSNIPDTELCAAVLQAMRGQADDLGDSQVTRLVANGQFVEICDADKA
jgi:hypothetical protein